MTDDASSRIVAPPAQAVAMPGSRETRGFFVPLPQTDENCLTYVHPILLDFQPRPESRFGHGKPPHPQLQRMVDASRDRFLETMRRVVDEAGDLVDTAPPNAVMPWDNVFFRDFDAVALYGLLRIHRPERYFEIGSGNSTRFAREAIRRGGLSTRLISLDPHPRTEIDELCDEVIRAGLEDCDLATFDVAGPGDIVFIDGSHRAFTNSDVTVVFVELLPRLRPGVIVHIHDVFLPWDYPPWWGYRHYNEQYLLAAAMLAGPERFEVMLPNWHIGHEPSLSGELRRLLDGRGLTWVGADGCSFWFRMGREAPGGRAATSRRFRRWGRRSPGIS